MCRRLEQSKEPLAHSVLTRRWMITNPERGAAASQSTPFLSGSPQCIFKPVNKWQPPPALCEHPKLAKLLSQRELGRAEAAQDTRSWAGWERVLGTWGAGSRALGRWIQSGKVHVPDPQLPGSHSGALVKVIKLTQI